MSLSLINSFFLEKNMQSFFLKTLTQRCGRYVCLQLLQTLNILFENIRNETSICELAALQLEVKVLFLHKVVGTHVVCVCVCVWNVM